MLYELYDSSILFYYSILSLLLYLLSQPHYLALLSPVVDVKSGSAIDKVQTAKHPGGFIALPNDSVNYSSFL